MENKIKADSQKQQQTPAMGSLSIVKPPLAVTLVTGFFLTLSAVAWACFAKVPIKVTAIGVLLPIDKITYEKAMSSGNIYYFFGNESEKNTVPYREDVIRFLKSPSSFDECQLITLSKNLARTPPIKAGSQSVLSSELRVVENSIYAIIDNPSARESLLSSAISTEKGNRALRMKNMASTNQIYLSKSQLTGQLALLHDLSSLYKKGYVSNPNVLSQKQTVDSLKSSIDTSNATISDTNGQIISKVEDLRARVSSYINNYLFVASHSFYAFKQDHVQGQPVSTGDTVLVYSFSSDKLPKVIPVFMDSMNADQVSINNQISATPLGFDKSQYGGIKGKLVKLSMTSLSLSDVTNLTGLQSISASVSQITNSPVLALAELETTKNPLKNQGIYKWSSRGIPPAPVRFNDGLSIDITTTMVKPIELLMPALKRFTGLSSGTQSSLNKGN